MTPDEARELVFQRLDFISYAPLATVSALTGKRVAEIFEMAEKVYQNGQKKIATSVLNKFLESMNIKHPALSKTGRRFKIKYMTQKGSLPPAFVLFTNSKAAFAPAYEKFFVRKMREAFDLWGTPIKLYLRSR